MTADSAIEFIVGQVDAEAARRHVALSDVEREMLRFRETPRMAARTIAALQAFERDYDAAAYEEKIVDLLRSAYKRCTSTERVLWTDAVKRVMQGDWYLGVMLDRASLFRLPGDRWRLWLTGFALFTAGLLVVGVVLPLLQRYFSDEQIGFFGWLALMIAAGLYTFARHVFGAQAVDGATAAVIDTIMLRRKRRDY